AHHEAQAAGHQRQVRGGDRSPVLPLKHDSYRTGAALAIASALSFGVTIVVNRSLATTPLGVSTVLGVRFAIAAVLLLLVLAVRQAPLLPVRGERARVVLLGAVGYMLEATLFFMGLERGTAAAVSLLFYSYPAIVTLLEIAAGWEELQARTLLALALSAAGVVVV